MDVHSERGAAVAVALLAAVVMGVLGAALVLNSSSDTLVAANFRTAREAGVAADAAVDLAVAELAAEADWGAVLSGSVRARFVDGSASGRRQMTNGVDLDLADVVTLATCRKTRACTDAEMDATTNERPWGANNPRWTLYAHGPLDRLAPSVARACCYVVVMVGDDPSETDDDPRADGSGPGNPGGDVLLMRAEAFGPRRAHVVREAAVARRDGRVRIRAWRNRTP